MAIKINELNRNQIENLIRRSVQPIDKKDIAVVDMLIKKLVPIFYEIKEKAYSEGYREGNRDGYSEADSDHGLSS